MLTARCTATSRQKTETDKEVIKMKLTELYEKLGGSCTDVLQRIPSEQMLLKFVKLYPADPSEGQLEAAVEAKDWQTAFRAAHTLKGVAQNLGFEKLQRVASEITEALRGGQELEDASLLEEVKKEHKSVISAISGLDA